MRTLRCLFEMKRAIPRRSLGRQKTLSEKLLFKWAKEKAPGLYNMYNFYLNQIKLRFQAQANNEARSMTAGGKYMRDAKIK